MSERRPFPERGSTWRHKADGALALVVITGGSVRFLLCPSAEQRHAVELLLADFERRQTMLATVEQLRGRFRFLDELQVRPTRSFVEDFEPAPRRPLDLDAWREVVEP